MLLSTQNSITRAAASCPGKKPAMMGSALSASKHLAVFAFRASSARVHAGHRRHRSPREHTALRSAHATPTHPAPSRATGAATAPATTTRTRSAGAATGQMPLPMRPHTAATAAAADMATSTTAAGIGTTTGGDGTTMTVAAVMMALPITAGMAHPRGSIDGIGAVAPVDTGTAGTRMPVSAPAAGMEKSSIGNGSNTGGRARTGVTGVARNGGSGNGRESVAAGAAQRARGRGMGCRTRTCRSTRALACATTLS